ncbi:undecaprenyldiphospho-muramoylpentapeptide beta-N-acetylglucosaminyltransferase [Peptostreptococcus canis]|uniref:UDP-N-acetylglucosamine--N-acetylmuramyl-(pentapeptide) pyrophosphoryl-undecaprenol N-acetylglucosamine transferase n=1 Tax=Peptostreptococcus canis TaxID=1159213 RepID=A0ABR6TKG3_9FIRM|nr:undecaprenyldiphospho-muramoylpentapeptide beta-N-acetylglucosaminyltransferase [Peptostreptococcus canis]MBC2575894.1 undecaprenyldiphospho-muramoylpentapeptide beta-N-acetylglucosaminyltransferase [Peptostreptococcus canis]MBP1997985.1 UDP-N-acetylglucosamine--N-acetylmuramyl-(pentapeptide) pyrophosphoryl-undecaprenol N-acetylglucosamine transferase [Peptostreptococcus canis]
MKVILSGGGTGGHVYPAIAIANKIKENHPEAEILFVGTKNGIESTIVPKYGYQIKFIEVKGFKRKIDFENVKRVLMFLKSLSDSKKIIQEFKPDLVIGTGGYVSGSVVLKASKMGIKSCIHEQNSFPGITNKMLSKNVDFVMTSFDDSHKRFPESARKKLVLTGNPVREEILNSEKEKSREILDIPKNKKMLLVAGGSGGSEEINDALKTALPRLVKEDIAFTISTGKDYYEKFMKMYGKLNFKEHQRVVPYLDDMANNLAACDLVIGSAGAISMAEMTAIGVAAIIVPKAYTAENHQEYNAKSLESAGGGICITERELCPEKLSNTIFSLLKNTQKLEEMARCSRKFGKRDSIDIIYKKISEECFKK